MPFTVFYAWQSDRDERVCRYFIRDAAEAAIKKLAKKYSVEDAPAFDHATEGESGLVHIAETIKRKIRECGAIIVDLTHVAEYRTADDPPRAKRATNANVAIEFGYAMHVLHPRQIILVMNTEFGPPEDLPFDLRHFSFPIQYTLKSKDDPNFVTAKKGLTDGIATAIKRLIESGVLEARAKAEQAVREAASKADAAEEAVGRARAEETWKAFADRFKKGDFRGLAIPKLVRFIGPTSERDPREAFINFSIIPLRPQPQPLDLHAVDKMNLHGLKPMGASGWNNDLYGRSLVFQDDIRQRSGRQAEPPNAVTELNDDGSIFAATTMGVGTRQDGEEVIGFERPEYQVLFSLENYIAVLRKLGIAGPLEVRVGVKGVAGLYLYPDRPINWDTSSFRKLKENEYTLGPVTIAEGMTGRAIAEAMRPPFTLVWRDAGLPMDPCFKPDGGFKGEAT